MNMSPDNANRRFHRKDTCIIAQAKMCALPVQAKKVTPTRPTVKTKSVFSIRIKKNPLQYDTLATCIVS